FSPCALAAVALDEPVGAVDAGDRPANGRGRDLPEPGLADSLGRRGPHGTARRVDSSSEAVLQPGIDEGAVCAEGIERHAGVARRPRGVDRAQRAGTQFTPLAGTRPPNTSPHSARPCWK